jgi:drug/metabolite transporter (DMT)-like permease
MGQVKLWALFTTATFLGTAIGIYLMQVAYDRGESAGVIQTLLATSPLFVLPMAALLGERPTWRAVLGSLIATAGVAAMFGG